MAKPTLATIPAAFGTKLYSVLPSTGVGDFTFTRASSATRIARTGYIETVASGDSRLDYQLNPDGTVQECPHYLLEPARTNLVTYSEDFSQSVWQKISVGSASAPIIASNFAVSPDGTQNATRVQFNISGSTSSDNSYLQSVFALDGSSSYTLSFYIKSNTGVNQDLSVWLNSVANNITVTNEWVRVEQTFSSNSTSNRGFGLAASGNIQQIVDVLIFGFQLEQGSYPTSYIPTNGTAITRAAETATGSGDAATFNDSEGVLMFEVSTLTSGGSNRIISLTDGTSANKLEFNFDTISNRFTLVFAANSLNQYIVQLALNEINFNKIAVKYKANDFALWINGIELNSQLSGNTSLSNSFDRINLANQSGGFNFYGNTKQLQYFDSTLTDAQLETLTSWITFQAMVAAQLYTIY